MDDNQCQEFMQDVLGWLLEKIRPHLLSGSLLLRSAESAREGLPKGLSLINRPVNDLIPENGPSHGWSC